jgi:hypothetical protein
VLKPKASAFLLHLIFLRKILAHKTALFLYGVAIHWQNALKIEKYMNKIKLTLIFLLIFSLECFSQESGNNGIRNTAISSGIGLGTVLAVVVSWERNKSVLLAFLHGIFSWFYVLYFVLTRKPEEKHRK